MADATLLPFEPAPSQRHSATSIKAAAGIQGATQRIEDRVIQHLIQCGDHGATDEEIQTALQLNGDTQRPRRVRLVKLGLVRDSGAKRWTSSRKPATVWVASRAEGSG